MSGRCWAPRWKNNLAMIRESVAYLNAQRGKEVIYDAEHFFDGYKANADYALATLQAAAEAERTVLVLCETNGGCLPWEVEEIVRGGGEPRARHASASMPTTTAAARWPTRSPRCARGCVQVQGTVNGYGERVGNADLVTIIPDLQLKMGSAR